MRNLDKSTDYTNNNTTKHGTGIRNDGNIINIFRKSSETKKKQRVLILIFNIFSLTLKNSVEMLFNTID